MPSTITCPNCRRVLELPEGSPASEVRCPACQCVFSGAATGAITAQAPATVTTNVQPRRPPARLAREEEDALDDDVSLDAVSGLIQYRPARGVALAAKTMLVIMLLSEIALLGSNYLQYQLAQRLRANQVVPDAELASNDARQLALGIAHMAIYLVCTIAFIVWFHRAHANLVPLGARDLKYTSGWAIGSWFVPFLNLVRPVQIAQEIWRNSDPDVGPAGSGYAAESGNSMLIGVWWAAWLISEVISNIAMRMEFRTPQTPENATIVQMVAGIASIIAAFLALGVVSTIEARQSARAEALQETAA